jgi:hypothetical protein
MNLHRLAVAAVLVTLALAGCNDGGSGPVTPSELLPKRGDHQSAARATPLPDPIVVGVVDRSGNGVGNVTVTFAVNEGTIVPRTAVTDANGQVQAVWTLGATIGDQTAIATARGLVPLTLSATALDPCDAAAALPYTLETTIAGTLVPTDCVFSHGGYGDIYASKPTGVQSLVFGITTERLYPDVGLYDESTNIVAITQWRYVLDVLGSPAERGAGFRILARPDYYLVGAIARDSGETGPYTLSSAAVPAEVANCQDWWVTRGIQTTQQVLGNDCVETDPYFYPPTYTLYSDGFLIILYPGETVRIEQSSTVFDAALTLWDLSASPDVVVASDDNSGGGTNALLSYTAAGEDPKVYRIVAGTAVSRATGPYTLSIAPPDGESSTRSVTPLNRRDLRSLMRALKR